jgi:DNA ligase-4
MVEDEAPEEGRDVAVSANDPNKILFAQLCDLFEAIRGVNDSGRKGSGKKWKILDGWMAEVTKCGVNDRRTGFFSLYRLMLPHIDKERSAYHLKEAALARVIGLALGLERNRSPDFKKLEAWRKGGAGIFVDAVQECCGRHMQDGYVKRVDRATIGDVNEALDKLATLKLNNEKVPVIRSLMDRMDARQMRWLAAVIIKDMKLGYGEAAIIRHFHRDAEDLYNVCCDLRRSVRDVAHQVRGVQAAGPAARFLGPIDERR